MNQSMSLCANCVTDKEKVSAYYLAKKILSRSVKA